MTDNKFMRPLLRGSSTTSPLYQFYLHKRQYDQDPDGYANNNGGNELPFLCGYRLPIFQRPAVWTNKQQIRFIESLACGIATGTMVINTNINEATKENITDMILLDGQQRLTALSNFWDNKFKVFDYLWDDVPASEQRGFLMTTTIPIIETQFDNQHDMKVIYDRMNFGGTHHTPEQRALPENLDVLRPKP